MCVLYTATRIKIDVELQYRVWLSLWGGSFFGSLVFLSTSTYCMYYHQTSFIERSGYVLHDERMGARQPHTTYHLVPSSLPRAVPCINVQPMVY